MHGWLRMLDVLAAGDKLVSCRKPNRPYIAASLAWRAETTVRTYKCGLKAEAMQASVSRSFALTFVGAGMDAS